MSNNIFIIDEVDVKKRLDNFVFEKFSDQTRSHIKKMIDDEKILVNQKQVKAGYALKLNDEVIVEICEAIPSEIVPENIDLNIIYEDSDLLVINKPQGMVVHPAVSNYSGTLVNALLFQVKDLSGINGVLRPGIVHRLDKDTSGLLLVAKNDKSHVSLSSQIQNKTCKRFYRAIVEGIVKEDGVIETRIGRDPKNRLKQAVVEYPKGKVAITHYKVLEVFDGYSYVEFELKTGRTHQIRVHSKYINHPIVGDELYNPKKSKFNLKGQLLHAYKIEFDHPSSSERLEFSCELPDYFVRVLNNLRGAINN